MNNRGFGIFAIVLGLLVIAFPMLGVIATSVIIGFATLLAGVWLLVAGFSALGVSKPAGILSLVLGFLAVLFGVDMFFNYHLLPFLTAIYLYMAGIILILAGAIGFFMSRDKKFAIWAAVVSVLLGILYIIMGSYAFDPFYLGILIGVSILANGVFAWLEPAMD